MPTLENTVPVISANSLNRKASRSSVVWMARKAAFMGNAIPRLERAQKILHERLCALRNPVEMIAKDGCVVHVMNDDAIVKVVRGLIEVIEAERGLLGFPSPGRRRDEPTMRETSVPGVVQDAIEPSGPAESASGPTAPGASSSASSGPTAGPTDQAPPAPPAQAL